MTLHPLRDSPPPWLGEALERFEARFRYPLGSGMSFRISHGRAYLPFFQAMGDATVWVAECGEEVVGTLAAIQRTLHFPNDELRRVAYLCDLKVMPDGRAGRTLATLAQAAATALTAQGMESAYSVVMEGTARSPANYTGRLGIPPFVEVAGIVILKVLAPASQSAVRNAKIVNDPELEAVHASLSRLRLYAEGGNPALRSQMQPVPLVDGQGQSCGIVEDTRRGKCLWLDSGEELRAAHLSRFAYASVAAGARLVRDALAVALEAGFPALFVAVPAGDGPAFTLALEGCTVHPAHARVHGCNLPSSATWSVDTAEI